MQTTIPDFPEGDDYRNQLKAIERERTQFRVEQTSRRGSVFRICEVIMDLSAAQLAPSNTNSL